MKNLARFLSPVALFAWGALMLYFYGSGRLNSYLIPLYRPGVAVAGVVMVAIAVGQLFALRGGGQTQLAAGLFADDGSDELTSPNRVRLTQCFAFGLLVVPVWAASGVSKDHFTEGAMLNRGVVTSAANLPGRSSAAAVVASAPVPAKAAASAVYEPPLPGATPIPASGAVGESASEAEQYLKKTADGHIIAEVTDLLFASEDDTMRPVFESRTVELLGQFMPVKDGTDGRFQLVRMFMVCCAADARPVGVQSLPPAATAETKAKKLPEEMAWTKVVGTVSFPMENGRRIPLIHATSVTPTDPPAEAMLY